MELSEGVRALDQKSACEVGRNYAKFEFTVNYDVEIKESRCRLEWFDTLLCLVYGGGAATTVNEGNRALDGKSAFDRST